MKHGFFKALLAVCLIAVPMTLAFGQKSFKVWAECSYGCDRPQNHQIIHFEYGGGLQITVETGYPAVIVVTDDDFQTAAELELIQNPTKYFADKKTGKKVAAALGAILQKVYALGEYCTLNGVKGNFSETGRYAPLAELRKYLNIGWTAETKPIVSENSIKVYKGSIPISLLDEIENDEAVTECAQSTERSYRDFAVTFFSITPMDLDGDGQNELLVSAGGPCFGASGAYVLLYRESTVGMGWQKLGTFDGNSVMVNTAQNTSNGFRNLIVKAGSLFDMYETSYRFDGRQYQSCTTKKFNRASPNAKWKLTEITESTDCVFVINDPQDETIIGYIDVLEKVGAGCRIRVIEGEKFYTGVITFKRLTTLTRQRIINYEDALRVLGGRRIRVKMSGTTNAGGASGGNFAGITEMIFPRGRQTGQATQTWNERTTERETIIDLSTDILFDFDKATIKPEAIPSLIRLARLIRQSKSGAIQLNGFTDSKGTDEYNLNLSERRAEAVKQWLASKGSVDEERLQTKGFGENQPVAPNSKADGSDNPAGRQKNRRVEVRIPRSN